MNARMISNLLVVHTAKVSASVYPITYVRTCVSDHVSVNARMVSPRVGDGVRPLTSIPTTTIIIAKR